MSVYQFFFLINIAFIFSGTSATQAHDILLTQYNIMYISIYLYIKTYSHKHNIKLRWPNVL